MSKARLLVVACVGLAFILSLVSRERRKAESSIPLTTTPAPPAIRATQAQELASTFSNSESRAPDHTLAGEVSAGKNLRIRVRPASSEPVEVAAEIFARCHKSGWTRIGSVAVDVSLVWDAPIYPCELIAQTSEESGRLALERVPESVEGRGFPDPEVTIILHPGARISGEVRAENHERLGPIQAGEVFYVLEDVPLLPSARGALLELPRSIGGFGRLDKDSPAFSIRGLDPTSRYRLWAASPSRCSLASGRVVTPGQSDVVLELYDVLCARMVFLDLNRQLAPDCLSAIGPYSLAFQMGSECIMLTPEFLPLSWTDWVDSIDDPNSQVDASLIALAPISAGFQPRIPVIGGMGAFQLSEAMADLTPLVPRPGDSSPITTIQCELLETGSIQIRFGGAVSQHLLSDQDAPLGTLDFYPLSTAGRHRRIALSRANYPVSVVDCIPIGLYQVLFTAEGTQLQNTVGPLPIVESSAEYSTECEIVLPEWGSIAVRREDSLGIEVESKVKIVLLETGASIPQDSFGVLDGVPLDATGVVVGAGRAMIHFVPAGTWRMDLSSPGKPNLDRLAQIDVVSGDLTSIRVRAR